jgi:hypothetical protein
MFIAGPQFNLALFVLRRRGGGGLGVAVISGAAPPKNKQQDLGMTSPINMPSLRDCRLGNAHRELRLRKIG